MAILYYTHNAKPRAFMQKIYTRGRGLADETGNQWIAVCRETFAQDDIQMDIEPGLPNFADIYRRILAGLEAVRGTDDTMVFLHEDDVLYCQEHFATQGRGPMVVYNLHLAYMCDRGYYYYLPGCIALSQLCGTLGAMRAAFRTKLTECLEARLACVEPAGAGYITGTCKTFVPNIDIRSGYNATWKTPADVTISDTLPGWAPWQKLWPKYSEGL